MLNIKLVIIFILFQNNVIIILFIFSPVFACLPQLWSDTEVVLLIWVLILNRTKYISIILINIIVLLIVKVELIVLLNNLNTLIDFSWLKFELRIFIPLPSLTVSLLFKIISLSFFNDHFEFLVVNYVICCCRFHSVWKLVHVHFMFYFMFFPIVCNLACS